MQTPRVLLITDAAFSDETVLAAIVAAARALPLGSFAVQLREKPTLRAGRTTSAWASQLREATRALGVGFVVNGNVGLAREVGADGVHFPGDATGAAIADGYGLWRSVAAHTDADVVRACDQGVDAVLVSPIFASPGKGMPRGVGAITRAAELAEEEVAVLALGGIGLKEARACREAGADGVAVIRSLLGASDPESVARGLLGG